MGDRWKARGAIGGGTVALGAAVVAAAVFLRFWRISWALTDGTWFPDEVMWANSAGFFSPFSWQAFVDDRHLRLPYPTGYAILSGLSLAIAQALGFSPFGGGKADAILVARLVSASAGVASVVLVGLFARRLGGTAVGIAAAALMAVVPLHAMQNHYASCDVVQTASVVLVMIAGHAVAVRGSRTSALLLGAAAGLAFGTKYTGLAMMATGGLVILDVAIRQRSVERAVDLGIWLVGGFLAAAALACPPCALDPARVVRMWRWQWNFASTDFANNHLVPSLGWYAKPYAYQLVAAFPFIFGWPVYVLVLAGLVAAVKRRDAGDRVVLATIVPYFLAMAGSPITMLRYLLPVLPGLVVLAARSGALVPRARRLWPGMVALACGYSFVLSASQIARYSLTPQLEVARSIAEGGTNAHVALPAKLQQYALLTQPLADVGLRCRTADDPERPPADPGPSCTAVADGRWFADDPDVFVLPELHEIAVRRDDPDGSAAAELDRLEAGELPYRPARRWRSWYLQKDLYTWLDPGFAMSEGAMGFTVYVRQPRPERAASAGRLR